MTDERKKQYLQLGLNIAYYRNARRALIRMPDAFPPKEQIRDVEKFFRSEWYQLLTSVDGEYLLRRLEEEAG